MKSFAPTVAFSLLTVATHALSVDEIVQKTNHASYYQGDTGKAKVEMTITNANDNSTRTRDFIILRRDVDQSESATDGDQQFFVYFRRPADVNKTVFMVHKKVKADDDRWLYLPALDLVKRIAASDKRTSFVGSHFFYEDVSGRNPSEDTHKLLEETDTYYVIDSSPKNPDSVEFSHFKSWIHKQTFIPVKVEYFDKSDKPYRTAEALGVSTIDGFPTVTKGRVTDLRTGSSTTMNYSEVTYNIDLPADTFTERYLRNPPRKLLR